MKDLTKGIVLAATFAMSSGANAAFIDAFANANAPGVASEQVVPGDNDYATRDKGIWTADAPLYSVGDTVLFGNNLKSTSTGKFKLTFTYLGAEAGDINSFYYGGTEIFQTTGAGSAVDSTFSVIYDGGLGGFLDFSFINEPGVVVKNDEDNGSQYNDPLKLNTSTNFNLFQVSEDYFLISFDDGYRGDDNHDDMVIAVRATSVPEPGTLALMGLGIAGMALRFKAKK